MVGKKKALSPGEIKRRAAKIKEPEFCSRLWVYREGGVHNPYPPYRVVVSPGKPSVNAFFLEEAWKCDEDVWECLFPTIKLAPAEGPVRFEVSGHFCKENDDGEE